MAVHAACFGCLSPDSHLKIVPVYLILDLCPAPSSSTEKNKNKTTVLAKFFMIGCLKQTEGLDMDNRRGRGFCT